jgi:hypothetical protein
MVRQRNANGLVAPTIDHEPSTWTAQLVVHG